MATILCLSSQVLRGTIGTSAMAPALWALGHEVWTLPTLILSHHPGYGRPYRTVTPARKIAQHGAEWAKTDALGQIDAVITGYLASPEQGPALLSLVQQIKRANPDALHVADPVMGDWPGGAYVSAPIIEAQKNLAAAADLITPNHFEAMQLLGSKNPNPEEDFLGKGAWISPQPLLAVTSYPTFSPDLTSICFVGDEGIWQVAMPKVKDVPNGMGDLFTALMTGHLMHGLDPLTALQKAAGSTSAIAALSAGARDLALGKGRDELIAPSMLPELVQL